MQKSMSKRMNIRSNSWLYFIVIARLKRWSQLSKPEKTDEITFFKFPEKQKQEGEKLLVSSSIDKVMLRLIFLVDFFVWVRLRQKNGFCVLVDVHKMAINRKVLCRQYASTTKLAKSINIICILWLYWEIYWLLSVSMPG